MQRKNSLSCARRERQLRACRRRFSGRAEIGGLLGSGWGDWARESAAPGSSLSDDFIHHLPVNVGQPEVSSGITVRELLVIEPEKPQNGRVEVVHVDRIFCRLETRFIRSAVNIPALYPSTGEPHGEAIIVMVAAVEMAGVRTRRR